MIHDSAGVDWPSGCSGEVQNGRTGHLGVLEKSRTGGLAIWMFWRSPKRADWPSGCSREVQNGRTGHLDLDVLEKSRTAIHPAAVGLAGSSSKKKCQIK